MKSIFKTLEAQRLVLEAFRSAHGRVSGGKRVQTATESNNSSRHRLRLFTLTSRDVQLYSDILHAYYCEGRVLHRILKLMDDMARRRSACALEEQVAKF
jgi:hypothetical protein